MEFPVQFPVLKTKRLLLRPVYDRDAGTVFRLYSDKRVMEMRGEALMANEEEALKKIFGWRKLFAEGNGIRWAIEFNATKKMVGTLGIKNILHQHQRAEVGYDVDPDWWNRWIMTEALQTITDYGFNEIKLHSFEANITPGHIASQRVLEKLGFRNEAHFRENYFYEGWWDSSIWSLRK